jgi:tRNA A-37 threonylcarbamoyl transferase component Bud32
VLKIQKLGKEQSQSAVRELFDTEIKAYDRLKPLQGVVVPQCYGHVRYNGRGAIVLEHLGGVSLASPEGATLQLEELSSLLQSCHRAIHAYGVDQEDPQPSNFQLLPEKIMALDFERVAFDKSAEDMAFSMKLNIEDLATRYQQMQAFFRHEGMLEAA